MDDNGQKAIDLLIRFKNCKMNRCTPTITEQGMNYLLMIMSDEKPHTASELAEDMGVSMARVTALIQKMEDKGYVVRKVSDEDKRVSLIKLTEQGLNESNSLLNKSFRIISEIINEIGYDKTNEFVDILYVIRDILEKEEYGYAKA